MAGPWEQFASATPTSASPPTPAPSTPGPWDSFAAAPKPAPDMSATKKLMEVNVREASKKTAEGVAPSQEPFGIIDAIEAGWQVSTSGLIQRGKLPDKILPQDAGWAARLASAAATIAGDVPAMLAGGVAGAGAGAVAGTPVFPIVGTVSGGVVGAAFGAGAAPAGLRAALMQHYEKGDIQDAGDFMQRAGAILMDSFKEGAINVATMGVGGKVAGTLAKAGVTPALQATGRLTSEVATMTTMGRALEGEMPSAQDFMDGALLVGALHGVTKVSEPAGAKLSKKMRDIYAKTGMKPSEIIQEAQADPAFLEELAAKNVDIPERLKSAVETFPGQEEVFGPAAPEKVEVKAPDALVQQSAVLGDAPVEQKLLVEPDVAKPEISAAEGEAPPLSPDAQAVRERWSPSQQKKEKLTLDKVITNAIDDLHPVKQLQEVLSGGKPLDTLENPYESMRRSRGAYGVADNFIKNGPSEFGTYRQTGTKGLEKILEPHKGDIEGLNDYLISKAAVDLSARGIETGIPLESAKKVVAEGSSKYDQAAQELFNYRNDTLKYLKDAGIVSEEAYKKMLDMNRRVPLYRMQEGETAIRPGRKVTVYSPVKGIKGSELTIVDPIEAVIKETYQRVTLAERNRALSSLAKLYDENPDSGLMEKVRTEMKPISLKPEEIQKLLDEKGIDFSADDPFTIFRPKERPLAKDEIAVFRDGKREVFKVAPDVAEAIRGQDSATTNFLVKMLSVPAKTLRAGTVTTPAFVVRDVFRDQLSAFINSDNLYVPFVSLIKGMSSIFKNDEMYQYFKKTGGSISAAVSIDRNYIDQNIFKLSKDTGLMDSARNVIRNPLQLLQVMSENISNATRVGAFIEKTGGDTSPEALAKAGFAARDVTLDFQKIGAKTRAINSIVAFWNAQVQGMAKTADVFAKNPVGATAKAAAAITVPSVLLWWANKDDERYKGIPRWQKDMFWIVMTDETIYRIPKPFELGVIFGSLPERLLDAMYSENPGAFKDFGETLMQGVTPNVMPNFAAPLIEKFANRSTFTGSTLIPYELEKVLPEEQFTPYTSATAKTIGKMITSVPGMRSNSWASPIIIDNTIRAWSGDMGKYAVAVLDQGLYAAGIQKRRESPPESTLADIPFVKSFIIRYPSASDQRVQDFNQNFKESQQLMATAQMKFERGDLAGGLELRQAAAVFGDLKTTRESLGNLRKAIEAANENPKMAPHEKRQIIDRLYTIMIHQADLANKRSQELKKLLK